jgi:hypothetical protein
MATNSKAERIHQAPWQLAEGVIRPGHLDYVGDYVGAELLKTPSSGQLQDSFKMTLGDGGVAWATDFPRKLRYCYPIMMKPP